ncbi:MAG: cobalt ECF transporter T component CbiQ, partial [Desulfobacteraceae bacterium]|nr:cobalt ECF transporter T component CbiQ [Desulfobacteraceae bacterium]
MSHFFEPSIGENVLTRADARLKVLGGAALLLLVLASRDPAFPLLAFLLGIGGCLLLRVPPRTVLLRFSEPLFIALMVVVLQFFFTGRDVLFAVHLRGVRLAGHLDGLLAGLRMVARLLGAVSVVALLGFATPFTDFLAALSWLRVPRLLIEIIMLAYRCIFMLFDEARTVYQSQRNRLGYATPARGVRSFGILAGAVTLSALEHSEQMVQAMTRRGYEGHLPVLDA